MCTSELGRGRFGDDDVSVSFFSLFVFSFLLFYLKKEWVFLNWFGRVVLQSADFVFLLFLNSWLCFDCELNGIECTYPPLLSFIVQKS